MEDRKHYSSNILSFYIELRGFFWVRFFGYGFSVKNINHYSLYFSERIGKTKTLRLGKWSIKFLNK